MALRRDDRDVELTMKRFFEILCVFAFSVAGALAASFAVTWAGETATFSTSPMPPYFVQGCLASYSSTSVINVSAGQWKDSTNTADVTGFAATTADLTATGAGGTDQKVISQTGSSSSPTITASADITANFNASSNLSGTLSSSSTTVTGTSTKFLTEVAVGDLIGNSTRGYSRVTAIASDTSLTIVAAFPASSASGDTMKTFYGVTIWIGSTGTDKRMVNTISAAGTAIVVDVTPGALSTLSSGQTLTIGVCPNLASESTTNYWMHIWLRSGGSGKTATWSTQRKTPYSLSGYTTAVRRVGAMPIIGGNSTPTLNFCYQQQFSSLSRDTYYQDDLLSHNILICNNATAPAAWTALAFNMAVPPASTLCWTGMQSGGANPIYVRPRSTGSSATRRPYAAQVNGAKNSFWLQLDGAQAGDWCADGTTQTSCYMWVGGFREDLTQ